MDTATSATSAARLAGRDENDQDSDGIRRSGNRLLWIQHALDLDDGHGMTPQPTFC